jgi:cupin 2 domain-containing protein
MMVSNLFAAIPDHLPLELFETLLQTPNLRVERIVSRGHATPPNQWYDQETSEWVLVLQGSAGLQIEGQADVLTLQPGDYAHLPAHMRHRVEWTDASRDTIWLAIHYQE